MNNNINTEGRDRIRLQPYTTEELASLYNDISIKTFIKWIKPFKEEIGKKIGFHYNIKQVEIIFERLGWPEEKVKEK